MKKLILLLLAISILTACGTNSDIGTNIPASVDNGPASGVSDKTSSYIYAGDIDGNNDETCQKNINGIKISSVVVDNKSGNTHFTCTDPELINELLQQIGNQKYANADKLSDVTHRVEFRDPDDRQVLVMDFGYNVMAVDRDTAIGQVIFTEGAYEAGETPWSSFSFFLDRLEEGYVMEPAIIKLPAAISMPDQYWKLQLNDKGNQRLNNYEACAMLYGFADSFIAGRDFTVTDSRRYYDYEEMQAEKRDIENRSQSLTIRFNSSDTRLQIDSRNGCNALALAESITLARLTDKPEEYVLLTDKMIFAIKPDDKFNKGFKDLFAENSGESDEIDPAGVKEMFDNNKPYYMEYICSNLGISEWTGREPDRLEIKEMKLDLDAEPYTVVNIYNPYDLRMLVYRPKRDGSFSFAGDIVFGGRNAGTEYELIRSKEEVWIKGISCKGHGTGVSMYYSDWYHITEDGVQLALSYPIDAYTDGPYGGYSVSAAEAVKNKAKDMRVQVAYEVAKRYYLFLDTADEYGTIELKGKKKVEFVWNSEKGAFEADVIVGGYESAGGKDDSREDLRGNEEISKFHGINMNIQQGVFDINADCPEIDQKCDAMLKRYYGQLSDIIDSLASDTDERLWKSQGINTFLRDCSDCEEKTTLLKKLYDICPDILR